jgi:hypothetical protein
MKLFRKMKERIRKQREKGVALFIALVALLLMAAIATGMMFMANTESAINYNYRDAQFTYFAAGAGIEDAREMLRSDRLVDPEFTPKGSPSTSNAKGIIYVLNPLGGETIEPWNMADTNPYKDDELCHEFSAELGIKDKGANLPCDEGAPPGSYTPITSRVRVNGGPLAGSNSALVYKWVRITLKYNSTLVPLSDTSLGYPVVDLATHPKPTAGPDTLVCWENQAGHEFLYSGLPLQNVTPTAQPSEFELAALQQAIDAGLGSPAVFMFGGKGKSSSTSGTTTGASSTTGTTTGTSTTGTTTGTSTTGTTSGTTTGTTTATTSGTTTGTTSATTTTGTTTGTASGTTTGTTTSTTTTGTTTGTTTTGTTTGTTTAGTTTGTTSGTTTGRPGYYASIDDCNAKNERHYSVYLVTSMAVSRRGAKRMAQYEISRASFPQIPGGLTFNGPGATYAPPSSTNYNIDGVDHATKGTDCNVDPLNPKKVHAITAFTPTDQKSIQDSITKYPDHYTGLGTDRPASMGGPLTPDVVDGSTVDPQTGYVPLDGLTTVKENTDLVDGLSASADLVVPVKPGDTVDANKIFPKSSQCYAYPFGTLDKSAPAACQGTRITVVDGNLDVANLDGAGILVVTGDITISGHVAFDGLILVIGTGKVVTKGGANVDINGGLYVANTKDPSGNLGAVSVDMSGGGNSNLYYDSCKIANATAGQSFRVITYREMTY